MQRLSGGSAAPSAVIVTHFTGRITVRKLGGAPGLGRPRAEVRPLRLFVLVLVLVDVLVLVLVEVEA